MIGERVHYCSCPDCDGRVQTLSDVRVPTVSQSEHDRILAGAADEVARATKEFAGQIGTGAHRTEDGDAT